jgi:hypothetical protein
MVMKMIVCAGCAKEIEAIEEFPGGICVECYSVKWEASQENFEQMTGIFAGQGIFK